MGAQFCQRNFASYFKNPRKFSNEKSPLSKTQFLLSGNQRGYFQLETIFMIGFLSSICLSTYLIAQTFFERGDQFILGMKNEN